MGRHSSFGSRLGAYRNRQIRLEIGRNNRRYKKNIPPQTISPEANAIAIVFIIGIMFFISIAFMNCGG